MQRRSWYISAEEAVVTLYTGNGVLVEESNDRLYAVDENGKTNLAPADVGGSLLLISQFTLYGSLKSRKSDLQPIV